MSASCRTTSPRNGGVQAAPDQRRQAVVDFEATDVGFLDGTRLGRGDVQVFHAQAREDGAAELEVDIEMLARSDLLDGELGDAENDGPMKDHQQQKQHADRRQHALPPRPATARGRRCRGGFGVGSGGHGAHFYRKPRRGATLPQAKRHRDFPLFAHIARKFRVETIFYIPPIAFTGVGTTVRQEMIKTGIDWDIPSATATYNIDRWGAGYFAINAAGQPPGHPAHGPGRVHRSDGSGRGGQARRAWLSRW